MSHAFTNYELRWPADLFASEGQRVLSGKRGSWEDRASWLMTEAFSSTTPVADFEDVGTDAGGDVDPWSSPGEGWGQARREPPARAWFADLVNRAGELRHAAAPRPYWPQRHADREAERGTGHDVRRTFVRLVNEFSDNGYLAEAFGQECVDDSSELPDAAQIVEKRLGIAGLWPLVLQTWDEGTFYGLVEVFHDLVSRPRSRYYHSYSQCGWHYAEFHNGPGRELYRWKVNTMLREAGLEYELAAEGDDLGRLVAVTDDARGDLVHQAMQQTPVGAVGRVRHAVALYRGRESDVESKRSAILALAGVLEERRELIIKHLGKSDGGVLFQIANQFNLRHHRDNQLSDYPEAFLDWIFWWYLATVELTNRLLASGTS